jgi:predicted MFS family arabinose efflux permease
VVIAALRSRDFRLLWLGQSASVIGDGLIIVAIGLYVTQLTNDPSDVGLVLGAYVAPLALFLLFGGVIADRLPRQAVMIAADVIRAVLHGILALLIAAGAVQIWQMAVIGVLFGTAQAFFQPAYAGLVPQTVPEREIQSAQALTGVSRELSEFVGPAVATALVFSVGGAAAFAVDALTFVVSALTLSRVRARSRGDDAARSTVLAELREGWTAVRQRAWVWVTISVFAVSVLVALAPFFVLGPAVSRDMYGTAAVFGITNVAWGAGTVAGATIGARWRPRRPMFAALLVSVVWPLTIVLFAVGTPLPVLYGVTAAAGLGMGLFGVWWETALAQRIPAHLLSRVSAWDWLGAMALLPIGYLAAGPMADLLGATTVLVGGGLIGLLAIGLGLLPTSTRRLTRIDDEPLASDQAAPEQAPSDQTGPRLSAS